MGFIESDKFLIALLDDLNQKDIETIDFGHISHLKLVDELGDVI